MHLPKSKSHELDIINPHHFTAEDTDIFAQRPQSVSGREMTKTQTLATS